MTEQVTEKLPFIEDMRKLNGVAYRLSADNVKNGKVELREEYLTGWMYWNSVVKAGKGTHMVGVFQDGKFMTRPRFEAGSKFQEDSYEKYRYKDEESGNMRNYFEKKYIGKIELLTPVSIPLYDSQLKKDKPVLVSQAFVNFTSNIFKQMMEVYSDPRTNPYDYLKLAYNAKAPPVSRYSVKFYQAGTPHTTTPTAAAPTNGPVATTPTPVKKITLFPHEKELLSDIVGEETTPATVVDYLTTLARKNNLEGLTPERINTIANAVVVNGVVTL